jgi:signal transduction histidine kinase
MAKPLRAIQPTPETKSSILLNWDELSLPMLLVSSNEKVQGNQAFSERFTSEAIHVTPQDSKVIPLPGRNHTLTSQVLSQFGLHEQVELKSRKASFLVDLEVIQAPKDIGQALIIVRDARAKTELEEDLADSHLEIARLHQTMVHNSKLTALGELSAGLAHELNQPLQAILGYSAELQSGGLSAETQKEFLDDLVQAARTMADIVRTFRSFARDAKEEATDVALSEVIRQAIKLTRQSLLVANTDVEVAPQIKEFFFQGNSTQMIEVFVNLINNAKDAIGATPEKRGKIRITQGRTAAEETCLDITDNGSGITDEIKERIFDPFFTTKGPDQGTGLGLSIVHKICTQFQIRIEVISELGKGTTFRLIFPKKKNKE